MIGRWVCVQIVAGDLKYCTAHPWGHLKPTALGLEPVWQLPENSRSFAHLQHVAGPALLLIPQQWPRFSSKHQWFALMAHHTITTWSGCCIMSD